MLLLSKFKYCGHSLKKGKQYSITEDGQPGIPASASNVKDEIVDKLF